MRKLTNINRQKFVAYLKNTNWDHVLQCNNPSIAYDLFLETFMTQFNVCFPLSKLSLNKKKFKKPWMTIGLLTSFKNRMSLYKAYMSGNVSKNCYTSYRNKLTNLVRIVKKQYYEEFFRRNIKNGAAIWKMVNSVTKQSFDGPVADSNELNDFFCKLGASATSHLPEPSKHEYMDNITPNIKSFVLEETNDAEVLLTGLSLPNKNSSGYDELSPAFVKSILHLILVPLTYIFNLSFKHGIVPQKLKIAKIVPIYKSGDKHELINYRPISLLPTFSKILEKLMYTRLMSFINKFNILSNCQYGFRAGRNTSDALCNLSNYISEQFDNGLDVLGIFIDISKAFDSLSHQILLNKLYSYGFRGQIFTWLSNYLTDRYQYVSTNACTSSLKLIRTGIPQGSILGPLLFLIYINDLPNISKCTRFILFADDTTCLLPCSRYINNDHLVISECTMLCHWFKSNKLALNFKKCKTVYFTLNRNVRNIPDIILDNHVIGYVNSIKFLGCYIDKCLDWHEHINYVSLCMCKGISILHFVRHYFPASVKKLIYFAYVYPFMTYCVTAWGNSHATYVNRIVLLQKKAIRLIYNADYLAHTAPLAKLGNMLMFPDVYILRTAILMHRIWYDKNTTKYALSFNLFTRASTVISLRNIEYNFPITYCRTMCRKRSVFINGIAIWNGLQNNVKKESNVKTFKTVLFNSLISLYQ